MKTKLFLLMLIAVTLFSCQKEKNDPATTQDVSFTATQIDPGAAGLKGTSEWDWKCDATLNPDYAEIELYDGTGLVLIGTFRPLIFVLDGKLYTQAIKLAPGTYTVSKFLVMDDNNTPADYTDDEDERGYFRNGGRTALSPRPRAVFHVYSWKEPQCTCHIGA